MPQLVVQRLLSKSPMEALYQCLSNLYLTAIWYRYALYAVVCGIVYVLGFPLGVFFILYSRRRNLFDDATGTRPSTQLKLEAVPAEISHTAGRRVVQVGKRDSGGPIPADLSAPPAATTADYDSGLPTRTSPSKSVMSRRGTTVDLHPDDADKVLETRQKYGFLYEVRLSKPPAGSCSRCWGPCLCHYTWVIGALLACKADISRTLFQVCENTVTLRFRAGVRPECMVVGGGRAIAQTSPVRRGCVDRARLSSTGDE